MTFDQLKDVAIRRGFVRWQESGKIETLRVADDGTVLARSLFSTIEHQIRSGPSWLRCTELLPSQHVRVGDLWK